MCSALPHLCVPALSLSHSGPHRGQLPPQNKPHVPGTTLWAQGQLQGDQASGLAASEVCLFQMTL